MAFDFGLKHIGVAVGQTQTFTASALTTVSAQAGKPDWVKLDALFKEWAPDLLLIGMPLNMDDSESDMSRRATKFANRLNGRYQCPCTMVDERLSSFEAKQQSSYAIGKAAKAIQKQSTHALAAQIIAQTWLNTQKKS